MKLSCVPSMLQPLNVFTAQTESWENVDGTHSAEIDATIVLGHTMLETWECQRGARLKERTSSRIAYATLSTPLILPS